MNTGGGQVPSLRAKTIFVPASGSGDGDGDVVGAGVVGETVGGVVGEAVGGAVGEAVGGAVDDGDGDGVKGTDAAQPAIRLQAMASDVIDRPIRTYDNPTTQNLHRLLFLFPTTPMTLLEPGATMRLSVNLRF
jgi:hypothetical protein